MVILPNPIRSTINPACIWVRCNLYKHSSTKVTCAEVTGLQIRSHQSTWIVRRLQSAYMALCALGCEVITQVDCYKGRLLILRLRVSGLLRLVLWMAFDPGLYFLKMQCHQHQRMTQYHTLISPRLQLNALSTSSSDFFNKQIMCIWKANSADRLWYI